MLKSSGEIISAARELSKSGRRRVAVAVAQDADVIGAVYEAYQEGICDASLFGDADKIREAADGAGIPLENLDVVNQPDPDKAVFGAVEQAASGEADVIMKGFVSTSTLLKGVLDRKFNLRSAPTLSHVAVLTIPGYNKLLMLTDGGMVVKPTVEQKLDILKNAVVVGRALGIDPVRVALSAAVDTVTAKMPQTTENAQLLEMLKKEKTPCCSVAGPMTFDVATSAEIAQVSGIKNDVAGQADVYLVGTIEECNITTKAMIIFGGAIFAGVIVGARIPVSLVSRTDPIIGKKTSIALACLVSDYYHKTEREGG